MLINRIAASPPPSNNSTSSQIQGSDETSASNNEYQNILQRQRESMVTFRKPINSGDPLPDPKEQDYYTLNAENALDIREGHILRIWKPHNDVMHLKTVAVLAGRGRSWLVCLIIKKPDSADRQPVPFSQSHAEVKLQTNDQTLSSTSEAPKGKNLRPVTIVHDDEQGWQDNVYLLLNRVFDVGLDTRYAFTYCGELEPESLRYAKSKASQLTGLQCT